MNPIELEAVVENLNKRADRVEQILPTLATKHDLEATGLDLRQEMQATRQELMGAIAEMRAQMMMLFEDNKSEIRLLAEHMAGFSGRLDRVERILPTLATRKSLSATRQEIVTLVQGLVQGTEQRLRDEIQRNRRHE